MATTPLIDPGVENRAARAPHGTPTASAAGEPVSAAGEPVSAAEGEDLSRVLGHAVALCWSSLSQEAQQSLFEAAVGAEGEAVRHKLAMFLHEKHAKTRASVQARAIPEPDSLGG